MPGIRASTRTVPLAAHVTSRHLFLSSTIQTWLTAWVIRLGVRRRAPRASHLTGRAVTASCPAVHYSWRPGTWVAWNHPTRAGRAGNLKNAWVQGRCDGDRGKKLHVSDSTSQGQADPTVHCRPCPASGPLLRSQTINTQPVPSLGITTSNHAAAKNHDEDRRHHQVTAH